MGSWRDFIEPLVLPGAQPPHRQVEALCFSDDCRILPDGLIPAEHVAMQAACRMAGTTVDTIPCEGNRLSCSIIWLVSFPSRVSQIIIWITVLLCSYRLVLYHTAIRSAAHDSMRRALFYSDPVPV